MLSTHKRSKLTRWLRLRKQPRPRCTPDNCSPYAQTLSEQKPLSGPHVPRRPNWLLFPSIRRGKSNSQSADWNSLPKAFDAESKVTSTHTQNLGGPPVPRRKSLGDIFHRTKWSHESSGSIDKKIDANLNQRKTLDMCPLNSEPSQIVIDTLQMFQEPDTFKPTPEYDPPKLDVLSDFHQGNLNRSSTFRNSLDNAAADIKKKYDSTHSSLYEDPGASRLSSRHKSLPTHDPKSLVNVENSISLFGPTSQLSVSPITEKGSSNTASACQSCGAPTFCRSPDERGIPLHQLDRILGDSIGLRTPPLTSKVPAAAALLDPEHDGNSTRAMLTGSSLAPVQLHGG
ncbi:hypothetical protein B0T10DRAFT_485620 [Thelonectria olida]|uniref:Uncharacterized protein n=1 Tax=Thelonectria olida TaxID=1576542 RepID=A0A9P9APV9_9HYPO|nr:hypothetical protein B0T10DRAFT_485620 [Thelonectria olida]